MPPVTSSDGTPIAYDQIGAGPTVILVDGALSYRGYMGSGSLAAALTDAFSVITYDRRGRGESGDTPPYAVAREIEDIAALIDRSGGRASLFGASSGAALALHAAHALGGEPINRLALYEPPYDVDEATKAAFAEYAATARDLLAAGQRGDAVALFLADMLPPDMLDAMRQTPDWTAMEAVAHTLVYDNLILGDGLVPVEVARMVTIPTLVLDGGASPPFLRAAADALASAMPNAERLTLAGDDHRPSPETLAPVLAAFFTA